jgi:hypothetical protein
MHCIAYKTMTMVVAHITKAPFQIKENKKVAYTLTLQDGNSAKLKQKLEFNKLFNLKTNNTLMKEGKTSTP